MLAVGTERMQTAIDAVKAMVDEDSAVISVYYGQEVTDKAADAMVQKLSEQFPDIEIELNFGGQPIYYYIISVE